MAPGKPREVFPGVTVTFGVNQETPCIAGTGIATRVIALRFFAGETVADLAADYFPDYALPEGIALIEAALRWECLSPGRRKRRLAESS